MGRRFIYAVLGALTALLITSHHAFANPYPQFQNSVKPSRFAGNWKVALTSSNGETLVSTHAVLAPAITTVCEEIADGICDFKAQYDETADWKLSYAGSGNVYHQGFELFSSRMDIRHASGFAGRWGARSKLQFGSGFGRGTWTYGDDSGRESWVRLLPVIDRIEFYAIDGPAEQPPVSIVSQGQVGTVTGIYDGRPYQWGRGNRAPGTRPKFKVNMYGENLWGFHVFDLLSGVGLEPGYCRAIAGQSASFNNGVAGLSCLVYVWHGVTNGEKTLRLDNIVIPFDLIVDGLDDEDEEKTEIFSTVVLDDQLGRQQPKAATDNRYFYPFEKSGEKTGGMITRTLVITGKNLRKNGKAEIVSGDPYVFYDVQAVTPQETERFQAAAHGLARSKYQDEEEVLILKATLSPGVQAGAKPLLLNGETTQWSLLFEDQRGIIRFLRAGSTPLDFEERRFYAGETIRAGIAAQSGSLPLDGLELELSAVGPTPTGKAERRRKSLGIFALNAAEDTQPGQNMAVTADLLLTFEGDDSAPAAKPIETPLRLSPDDKLVATLVDTAALLAVPPYAAVDVLAKPLRADLWQKALERVSQCEGVGGDPQKDGFESETSTTVDRLIMMEGFKSRKTKITKGDHAALILIRDRMIPLVLEENQKLKPYIEASNPQRMAQRYYSDASKNPSSAQNAFWLYKIGSFSNPDFNPKSVSREDKFRRQYIDIPLAETLNLDAFSKRLKKTKVETRDLVNQQVARALKQQYDETLQAVERARAARDCNIDELLVIAGQKAQRAVASILPDLVKKEDGRWRPDQTARRYVSSVYLLGEEVRALNEYGDIDDAYKSMAIAAVAAPIAYAGSSIAALSGSAWTTNIATATGAIAVGADAIDMAYFGAKGIADYKEGEEDYLTALGLSPVLGAETVKEAMAKRQNAALAAVGILAPAVGGASGIKNLAQAKNINNGRKLIREKGALKSLETLSDAERNDLAAYYTYLKETDGSKATRLFKGERQDMEKLDALIKEAGGTPADSGGMRALTGKTDAVSYPEFSTELKNTGVGDAPLSSGNKSPVSLEDPRKAKTELSPSELAELDGSMVVMPPRSSQPGQTPKSGPAPEPAAAPRTITPVRKGDTFDTQLGAPFDSLKPADGVLDGSATSTGEFAKGTKITNADGTEELVVGKKLGGGGFTEAYENAADPKTVIKKRTISDNEDYPRDLLERMVNDSETGRKLLKSVEDDNSLFRVAGRKGEPVWVRDPDQPGRGYVVTQEENISSTVNGKTVSNAQERFDARDYGATAEEALTIQLAVRDLNQRGIVWTDNKLQNLDVVPDANSPTGYRVVFFDYDGFRPVKGADAAERYANARKTQRIKDRWNTNPNDHMAKFRAEYDDDIYDYTVFGEPVGDLFTAGRTKTGIGYLQLSDLPPEDINRLAGQIAQERGKVNPYKLPPGVSSSP
jgi:hypothetical protein